MMRYKVIDENGTVLFEGYDQECINFITNNPSREDIEKVSNDEYSRRFPDKFKCEVCCKWFDLKRQKECRFCSRVVCEFCLDEYGICEDCNSEEDKGNDVC